MNAVVVAVGSEMLGPGRRDTNAEWLVARLFDLGVPTAWRAIVDDDAGRIERVLRAAWSDAELVVITGGLGPTEDDRTREAVASAMGVPIARDPEMVAKIHDRFARLGRVPGPRQAVQADRPHGAEWIENPLGSAPGLWLARDGRALVALPGVPAEMKAMFDATVAARLTAVSGAGLARTTLKIAGRPESYVDDRVRDLYATPGTETTILAGSGIVELIVVARGTDSHDASARATKLSGAMRERLGDDVFGRDHDTLASVVGRLLLERRATVATAESCTAGLLGAALTDVPGSSAWYRGGLVCYADDLKIALAGVDPGTLSAHGAVSEEVSRELAAGARARCAADFALGITGIAGPDGGSDAKPVGTVHVALDDGGEGKAVKLGWPGDRDLIRRRAVATALDLLRRRLLS
jgi:nicotinamide-nucleotide amidase